MIYFGWDYRISWRIQWTVQSHGPTTNSFRPRLLRLDGIRPNVWHPAFHCGKLDQCWTFWPVWNPKNVNYIQKWKILAHILCKQIKLTGRNGGCVRSKQILLGLLQFPIILITKKTNYFIFLAIFDWPSWAKSTIGMNFSDAFQIFARKFSWNCRL